MKLREYQQQAVDAVLARFRAGEPSTLLVMPTASGKTVTVSHVIDRVVSRGFRVLAIAHREELIAQAAETIRSVCRLGPTDVQIEMAGERASPAAKVVCGSIATMRGKRLQRWRPDHFALIWVDEAHHSAAKTYRSLLGHFTGARLLGCTATPDRLDGKSMGSVFKSIAYSYEIADAIGDGYLSPLKVRMVMIPSFDISSVRTRAGDFVEADLDRELTKEPSLYEVARPTVELCGDRPGIVFAASVHHAELLAKILNEVKPNSADWVCGAHSSDHRRAVVDAYRERRVQFLVNVGLFTEGVDLPLTEAIVMVRPTQSRALYTQCVGRGLRLSPGKSDALIVDFTDNAANHRLVCALDVLDDSEDKVVRERARKLVYDGLDDPMAAMDEAARQVADEERLAAAREEEERARRREQVAYVVKKVNPFHAAIGFHAIKGSRGVPMTEKQSEVLQRWGLYDPELNRRQASKLIGQYIERINAGLATAKQAKLLASKGLNPDLPRAVASEVIGKLIERGYKVTPDIEEKYGMNRQEGAA